MIKRISKWGTLLILSIGLFTISSCSKDKEDPKPAAPTIKLNKLGTHEEPESKVYHINEGGHFEADITAPGLIQKINLEINQVSGYGTYSFKKEYTGDYAGQKEVLAFHDHPLIPEGSPIGEYVFRIIVTDQLGQVGTIESPLTVKVAEGEGGEHEHEH